MDKNGAMGTTQDSPELAVYAIQCTKIHTEHMGELRRVWRSHLGGRFGSRWSRNSRALAAAGRTLGEI